MTEVVLLLLAVIWAAVLLPPWLQNRRESRPSDSISTFRQQLAVLERATPGHMGDNVTRIAPYRAMAPLRYAAAAADGVGLRRSEVVRRRRDIFVTLLGAAGVTLPAAILLGGPVWMLHLTVDALLFGYTAMLIQLQQRAVDNERKVSYLPQSSGRSPELLLRRSAN